MPGTIQRAVVTVLVWTVAAVLLWWWHLSATRRRWLSVVISAAAVVTLMAALNMEGLREAPTEARFLMGSRHVIERASASASLPYYVLTGVFLLFGTAGLAVSDAAAERLTRHWLAQAIFLSVVVTAVRVGLEKTAAPSGWTWAAGITWLPPVVGAFFFHRLRSEGRGLLAVLKPLVLYAFAARGVVALLMLVTSVFRLGTHYDISSFVRVRYPFSETVHVLEPGSLQQVMLVGVVPQLSFWPLYTLVAGFGGALAAAAVAAIRARTSRAAVPLAATPSS